MAYRLDHYLLSCVILYFSAISENNWVKIQQNCSKLAHWRRTSITLSVCSTTMKNHQQAPSIMSPVIGEYSNVLGIRWFPGRVTFYCLLSMAPGTLRVVNITLTLVLDCVTHVGSKHASSSGHVLVSPPTPDQKLCHLCQLWRTARHKGFNVFHEDSWEYADGKQNLFISPFFLFLLIQNFYCQCKTGSRMRCNLLPQAGAKTWGQIFAVLLSFGHTPKHPLRPCTMLTAVASVCDVLDAFSCSGPFPSKLSRMKIVWFGLQCKSVMIWNYKSRTQPGNCPKNTSRKVRGLCNFCVTSACCGSFKHQSKLLDR